MRAAGGLVARMQIARGMKLVEAKKYVADKLQRKRIDLSPVIYDAISIARRFDFDEYAVENDGKEKKVSARPLAASSAGNRAEH
jgi:hypothetical protein